MLVRVLQHVLVLVEGLPGHRANARLFRGHPVVHSLQEALMRAGVGALASLQGADLLQSHAHWQEVNLN